MLIYVYFSGINLTLSGCLANGKKCDDFDKPIVEAMNIKSNKDEDVPSEEDENCNSLKQAVASCKSLNDGNTC